MGDEDVFLGIGVFRGALWYYLMIMKKETRLNKKNASKYVINPLSSKELLSFLDDKSKNIIKTLKKIFLDS